MPLPPALAARLAKRGLLKDAVEKPAEPPPADEAEEIIAEDYDDDHATKNSENQGTDENMEAVIYETVACPNKVNVYHECVAFCRERWGLKAFLHDPELDKKHARLLRRYPLAEEIVEVGDPETGRYYYWNTLTDEVSWLPPQHPRAKVSLPAEKLRELTKKDEPVAMRTTSQQHSRDRRKRSRKDSAGESDVESSGDEHDADDDKDDDKDFEQVGKEVLRRKKQSETDRGVVKKKKKDVNLDPMDPAAYSEIPKGKWSAGLEIKGSANTGADVTASGPLFQQRPYPSPGAVLRMNKGKESKDKE